MNNKRMFDTLKTFINFQNSLKHFGKTKKKKDNEKQ